MSVEVKTPVLPESVADAAIATWHKQPGEHVTEGENLVDLETDKIVLEVPAPVSGALEASSIPHVRIKVKSNYSLDEIKACIDSRLLNKITIAPKVKGRTIPAPLVKARPRNSGVVAPTAIAQAKTQSNKSELMSRLKPPQEQPAALPH